MTGKRNLYLCGLMGSGKSTIGRILAKELGCSFIDSDERVEEAAGVSISTLFERDGEAKFRELETRALEWIAQMPSAVVALGGGALVRAGNLELVRGAGHLVYLRASPSELASRLGRSADRRPLLRGLDEAGRTRKLEELLAERRAIYESADWIFDLEGHPAREAAGRVLDGLRRSGLREFQRDLHVRRRVKK